MNNEKAALLSRNPLSLAAFYKKGLGRRWTNQSEAAAALRDLDVNRTQLNRAIRVSNMPESVLALFVKCGINNQTARELVRLENLFGADELCRRAAILEPGQSAREVIGYLEGSTSMAVRAAKRTIVDPLERTKYYSKGLNAASWRSVSEAASILGWDRSDLSKAIAISTLPPQVLDLFSGRRLTNSVGETLLVIEQSIGRGEMSKNAKRILEIPRRLSINNIIMGLAGAEKNPDFDLKLRRRASKVTLEITFDAKDTRAFLPNIGLISNLLRTSMAST